MTTRADTRSHQLATAGAPAATDLEIVIPVYNEQEALSFCVRRLRRFLGERLPVSHVITIADNASADRTPEVASMLADRYADVRVVRLERKGRGNALREVWAHSTAEVVAYMDVDLSTDLSCLPDLVVPLLRGEGDIAIGSRLMPGATVKRGPKRELISRSYNLLLRLLLGATFSDAQCGFKAARREVIAPLLALVQDGEWFFDTELLHLAQRNRLAIREVPVRWVDDPDSRVDILATAVGDLKGVRRLRRQARAEQRGHSRAPAALRRTAATSA